MEKNNMINVIIIIQYVKKLYLTPLNDLHISYSVKPHSFSHSSRIRCISQFYYIPLYFASIYLDKMTSWYA